MALKAVAARIQGDVLQGMFFWWKASALLRPTSLVSRVVIEYDKASGVDDVAVFYDPPGTALGASRVLADFYQTKFHVDRSAEYDSDALCDSTFIKRNVSLLQRFHGAHEDLKKDHGTFRLHLVSNWGWKKDDPVGPVLREWEDGALPDAFFTGGPKSDLGKIRERWRKHLGLDAAPFADFARRLRFGVDFFARSHLVELLNGSFHRAGLKEIPEDRATNPYDSLTQQLITNGKNDFTRETFRELCVREGLIDDRDPASKPSVLGIRSFLHFAERIEDDSDQFVCLLPHFQRRYIRAPELWRTEVAPKVRELLRAAPLREREHHLLLDCHSSIAFVAGYEAHRKSGAQLYPVQKGGPDTLWRPDSGEAGASAWDQTIKERDPSSDDIAVSVSVTRDVQGDVERFLDASAFPVRSHLDHRPTTGIGAKSVQGGAHAFALADGLSELIRKARQGRGTVHLFSAAPNALLFFLAQHRAALGPIQLYEYDFDGERGGGYMPSVKLPTDMEEQDGTTE
jgi:hypothetical protein